MSCPTAEYISLGGLDSRTALFKQEPEIKVREDFDLTLTNNHSWKIEGPLPEPHVNVDAAIRYVTEIRNNTLDPVITKNAERSIAALTRLR